MISATAISHADKDIGWGVGRGRVGLLMQLFMEQY